MRARLLHDGRDQWGTVTNAGKAIRLACGKHVAFGDAQLLPPVTSGATIFALALNYADHSAELGFKAPEKPLIFLKSAGSFSAHRGIAPRPSDANQMHPECELVAIIGKPARRVSAANALNHVSGYTIACDYAIREYLENFYRPNFRVKSRDGCTPLGPWVVDACEIGDPQALGLSTRVNGHQVQHGSTKDMVFPVAELIAYLSGFMTLLPGDMILTGTPHGVHFVAGGDEVVCEIEAIGQLSHRVALVP